MLWIWLLTRNRHSFSTGPIEQYFRFVCAQCNASLAAFVRSMGYGAGRDIWTAQRNAQAQAEANAFRAVQAAGCPCCGQLQPRAIDAFERAARRAAWRRTFGLPIAAVFAVLALAFVGIFAVPDRHASLLLFGVAGSAATAAFGIVLGIAWSRVALPFDQPAGVWFSNDPARGPQSWFAARSGPAPEVIQPNGAMRGLGLAFGFASIVAAIVGLVLWSNTFRKVYVVNAMPRDVEVWIDGTRAGSVGSSGFADAPNATFEVRTGSAHTIAIRDGAETSTYKLDPDVAKKGWVLAPHAHARGLCLTSLTWYYGTEPKEDPNDGLLNKKPPGDFVVIDRSFDVLFTAPPATVDTQNGSSTTRSTLRALDCHELANENVKAWSTVAR
ncbi:MAG TPA: hypothetical protein VIF62_20185 [Labilithrix sp.]